VQPGGGRGHIAGKAAVSVKDEWFGHFLVQEKEGRNRVVLIGGGKEKRQQLIFLRRKKKRKRESSKRNKNGVRRK